MDCSQVVPRLGGWVFKVVVSTLLSSSESSRSKSSSSALTSIVSNWDDVIDHRSSASDESGRQNALDLSSFRSSILFSIIWSTLFYYPDTTSRDDLSHVDNTSPRPLILGRTRTRQRSGALARRRTNLCLLFFWPPSIFVFSSMERFPVCTVRRSFLTALFLSAFASPQTHRH